MSDVEILAALDFVPEVPCGTMPGCHAECGDGPARWVIVLRCPGCGNVNRLPICRGCWVNVMQVPLLGCVECRTEMPPFAFFYSITSIHSMEKGGG